jgi:hypothetical protein
MVPFRKYPIDNTVEAECRNAIYAKTKFLPLITGYSSSVALFHFFDQWHNFASHPLTKPQHMTKHGEARKDGWLMHPCSPCYWKTFRVHIFG